MRFRLVALLGLLFSLLAAPAQAQFNLDKLNINRLVDTVKSVARATGEIGEPEEIALGRDMAARLLGAARLAPDERLQRYVPADR